MCPERTHHPWTTGRESNPRPPPSESGAHPLSYRWDYCSSSTSQYKKSRHVSWRKFGGKQRLAARSSPVVGSRGGRIGRISSLSSFATLQGSHAATMLPHSVLPPRDRGITCSKVRSFAANFPPQYWQRKRS